MNFFHLKTFGFLGSCARRTSSMRCSRLFIHSLLAAGAARTAMQRCVSLYTAIMVSHLSASDDPPNPQTASAEGSLRVVVNGEPRMVPAGSTASDLLARLGIAGRPLAVELNRDVIPRSQLAAHVLGEGDELEIVTLVGGG
jgi:sulfur carrier protein